MNYTEHFPAERTAEIKLKDFPFLPRTLVAPMEGVTNFPIRNILAAKGGVGLLCTEFVRIQGHTVSQKKIAKHVLKTEGTPLSVQVMGNDADMMADSAAKISACGADVVDVNLGCPTAKALKGNVGAAMLRDPDLLYRVLSEMRAAVPGILSAKIRAGFDESDHILKIASAVRASGADFIAVHPRRRKDQYKGHSDWRIITLLKEFLDIPVIGNGDVVYADDAVRMFNETGCDAVMIGRGAMRNPWIFRQLEELQKGEEIFRPSGEDLAGYMKEVLAGYTEFLRPHQLLPRMKELSKFVSPALEDPKGFLQGALRSQDMAGLIDSVDKFIEPLKAEGLDLGLRS